jgi:hypothetical protein
MSTANLRAPLNPSSGVGKSSVRTPVTEPRSRMAHPDGSPASDASHATTVKVHKMGGATPTPVLQQQHVESEESTSTAGTHTVVTPPTIAAVEVETPAVLSLVDTDPVSPLRAACTRTCNCNCTWAWTCAQQTACLAPSQ